MPEREAAAPPAIWEAAAAPAALVEVEVVAAEAVLMQPLERLEVEVQEVLMCATTPSLGITVAAVEQLEPAHWVILP